MRAPKACARPGCGKRAERGSTCEAHRVASVQAYERHRGTAPERGYTARWAKYSRQYRREHPLCVHCKARGEVTPSAHVDHIEPVTGADDPKFFDPTNLQALCVACHNAKTAKERG